jgi:hypothetical protein
MKHRKINLVLTLDKLIVEVSKKMKKKIFQLFLSNFFQELSISASRPYDIRNLLIKSNKKKKNL